MIVGVGLDLIDRASIASTLERHGARLTRWVFTEQEWRTSLAAPDPVDSLAGCFAAKEACLKALGTGWGEGISLTDVELSLPHTGDPSIQLSGGAAECAAQAQVERVHVTIGRSGEVTGALVMLEGAGPSAPDDEQQIRVFEDGIRPPGSGISVDNRR